MAAGDRTKRIQPVKRHLPREEVVAGLHRAVDGRSAVRWLYGLVHPLSGATFFLMQPRVDTEAFNLAL